MTVDVVRPLLVSLSSVTRPVLSATADTRYEPGGSVAGIVSGVLTVELVPGARPARSRKPMATPAPGLAAVADKQNEPPNGPAGAGPPRRTRPVTAQRPQTATL